MQWTVSVLSIIYVDNMIFDIAIAIIMYAQFDI